MKTLKFVKPLSELILQNKKHTTWRVFDDKALTEGEIIALLVKETKEEFAKAKILHIKETTFGSLTAEDWNGHETFDSEEEMYATYSQYYNTPITNETQLKVIKFEVL